MLDNIDHLKLEAVVREIGDRRSKVSWHMGYAAVCAVLVGAALSEGAVGVALFAGIAAAIPLLGIRSERRKIARLQADREQLEARIGA